MFFPALLFAAPSETADRPVAFGVIGMAGGAVRAMMSYQEELNVRVEQLKPGRFRKDPAPDLSEFDVIVTSFASGDLKKQYKKAVSEARRKNPDLKVFCVGPRPICEAWGDWIGKENLKIDPKMAAYYGLSAESMKHMLQYTLVTYFGRKGKVEPPGSGKLVRVFHPKYGDLESVADFLANAEKAGWDVKNAPRVALGTWRHHVLFHQPKVIEALVSELESRGMLSVCLVADDAKFRDRLLEFKPDLVVMTSHTREPVEFWEKLNVPRLHAIWFTGESIDEWRKSNQPGMTKSGLFHQVVSAELKGATETLTSGGTESGRDSGEEIQPIPDRIRRIAGRANAWISLGKKVNAEKKLALIVYDREADKAGLLSGPAHNLNAPRSLLKFLNVLKKEGYGLKDIPADTDELLARIVDHGRQMGGWEPGSLDRLVRSGKAALVPEDKYRQWFEESVPRWRRDEVIAQWGEAPGNIMVWEHGGKRFLVLPKIDLGPVTLMTQPLKGETITASMKVQDPNESLLPPTHHFLAGYFWLQREFRPDAVMHFGTHGSEWLFPGKMAVNSRSDWTDILLGDLPNVNPWLSSNTSELLPCKRRAMAVTVDFQPPPLMEAGLSDELLNLESAIEKYESLEPGALKSKFARSVTDMAWAARLHRDLALSAPEANPLSQADIEVISKYLHDLNNEWVPASMHVLGEAPAYDQRLPYLVHSMGKRFIKAARGIFGVEPEKRTDEFLAARGLEILNAMFRQGLSMAEALKAAGATLPGGKIPEALRESLEMAVGMNAGLEESPREIENLLAALNGKFVPPGPSGSPERNPGVLPTGRNMFILNPEELPSRSSWELGSKLIEDYLRSEREKKGRYPKKIAFSLVPFATYSDFGITETQIFRLLGVRPVWDAKNRVRDVELIPSGELGRPRIDVFLSARSIYRDELPSMMRLLDKAIRMAASLKEKDNFVYLNSEATRTKLEKQGVPEQRAKALSQARMFGAKPEEILDSHNWFFYLTERSGEWETREDLLDVFMQNNDFVYAEGVWGEKSPEAFDTAIRDTESIMRSWYDNRDYVLSNKFAWWVDGTLSLAIKHISGKEPELLYMDVRDMDEAHIVDSTEALQRDFRARVTNPKWIGNMMKEGYAGGNLIAKNVDNLMGWKIMREHSVDDSNWEDVTDVYVRDRHQLNIREWFDKTNPYAFQKLGVTLMETIRKGFWPADEAIRLEITAAYAESVAKHGRASGVREGGNDKLETFIEKTLSAPKTAAMDALLKQYRERSAELETTAEPGDPGQEPVQGKRLEKKETEPKKVSFFQDNMTLLAVAAAVLLIVLAGFFGRGLLNGKKRK